MYGDLGIRPMEAAEPTVSIDREGELVPGCEAVDFMPDGSMLRSGYFADLEERGVTLGCEEISTEVGVDDFLDVFLGGVERRLAVIRYDLLEVLVDPADLGLLLDLKTGFGL